MSGLWIKEAADEIIRLRAEVALLKDGHAAVVAAMQAEIERLRAALEVAKAGLSGIRLNRIQMAQIDAALTGGKE